VIRGLGTDIIEVGRMRAAVKTWGDRFLKRIFSDRELSYCMGMADPIPHLAARFSAKEAAIKALSTVLPGYAPTLKDFEILNRPDGSPVVRIIPLENQADTKYLFHVSLSHERQYATAVVIIEEINK
jgi:holo-[acyl-carrier protein] synthase